MRKQEHLLQLINALTPSEKRKFKMLSSIEEGDKRYLKLYDELEGQKKYDAKTLCNKLQITNQQLADDKQRLTRQLFRCLRYIEDQTHFEVSRYNTLMDARIVKDRVLMDYSLELIGKAIDSTIEMEEYFFLPALLVIKQDCLFTREHLEDQELLRPQFAHAYDAANEIFELNIIYAKVVRYERGHAGADKIMEVMDHPILKTNFYSYKSLKAQGIWLALMFFYYNSVEENSTKRLEIARLRVAHFLNHPLYKIHCPGPYINTFALLVEAEIGAGNLTEALAAADRFEAIAQKSLPVLSERFKVDCINYAKYLKASTLRRLDRAGEALLLHEKMQTDGVDISVANLHHYTMEHAVALWLTGNYKVALNKLDELLMDGNLPVKVERSVRPLMMLLQIEIGNRELIPHLVKNARSWAKRSNRESNETAQFYKHILMLAKAAPTEQQEIYQAFNEAIDNELFGQLDLDLNLKSWFVAKMQRRQRA